MDRQPHTFLSLVSYNVLFPVKNKPISWLLDPDRRYKCQFDVVFSEIEPDILCLQEVTDEYTNLLENSKFFKEGYQHTPLSRDFYHQPMIVTKLPFTLLFTPESDETQSNQPTNKDDVNFIVINAHLIAYESKVRQRKQEMKFLKDVIKSLHSYTDNEETSTKIKNAVQNNNIILCGDLNLHFPGENKILEDSQFYDLWIERYSHFDGFTWDAQTNSMTKWMLPFDNRRMRLDRICIKHSKQIDFDDMKIIANKNAGRICLYPSDHFGLFATFLLSKSGFTLTENPRHKREMKMILQDETGFRSIERIVTYRVLTFALICIIITYAVYKYLFA